MSFEKFGGGGGRPRRPEDIPENKKEKTPELFYDLLEIESKLRGKLNAFQGKSNQEIIDMQRNFVEKYGEMAKIEMLNLKEDLAIWINKVHQNRLVTTNEANFLLAVLNHKSGGFDNYATLSLITLLWEIDLYLREEVVRKEFKK